MQPIQLAYSSGKTVWGFSVHPDGRVFNVGTKAWVAFVLGNLADYILSYTELASTGLYIAQYPDGTVLDVLPTEISYQQAGPSPALPDDLPPISIGQSQGSNVDAINASVLAAQNLQASSETMETAVVQAGTNTTTQVKTNLTGATDALYRGRVVIFASGAMNKAAAIITGFNASTGVLTFTAIPTAPSPGDDLIVV